MSQEIRTVISKVLTKFDLPLHLAETAEVVYTESEMMHTIRINCKTYKALRLNDDWKITQMK